jgi:hypothetical protein
MKDTQLEPARSIIALLGKDAICAVTGKHPSRVYRWMASKEKGGTGGKVPYEDAEKLLAHARENAIDLVEADFFDASRLKDIAARAVEAA